MNRRTTIVVVLLGLAALSQSVLAKSYVFKTLFALPSSADTDLFAPVISESGAVAFWVKPAPTVVELLLWKLGDTAPKRLGALGSDALSEYHCVWPGTMSINSANSVSFVGASSTSTSVFRISETSIERLLDLGPNLGGESRCDDTFITTTSINDRGQVVYAAAYKPDESNDSLACGIWVAGATEPLFTDVEATWCDWATPTAKSADSTVFYWAYWHEQDPETREIIARQEIRSTAGATIIKDGKQYSAVKRTWDAGPTHHDQSVTIGPFIAFSPPVANASGQVAFIAVGPAPDYKRLVLITDSGTLRVWEDPAAADTEFIIENSGIAANWLFAPGFAISGTGRILEQGGFVRNGEHADGLSDRQDLPVDISPDQHAERGLIISAFDWLDGVRIAQMSMARESYNRREQIAFLAKLADGDVRIVLGEPFSKYKQFKYSPLNTPDVPYWSGSLIVPGVTIAQRGCTIVSLATIATLYGADVDPDEMLDWVELFVVPGTQGAVNLEAFWFWDADTHVEIAAVPRVKRSFSHIVSELRTGNPVLLSVPSVSKKHRCTGSGAACGQLGDPACPLGQKCAAVLMTVPLQDNIPPGCGDLILPCHADSPKKGLHMHSVVAWGIDPSLPKDAQVTPKHILISDPGKADRFYASVADYKYVGWYLDPDFDGTVEDRVAVTLQDYFNGLNRDLGDTAKFNAIQWFDLGRFYVNKKFFVMSEGTRDWLSNRDRLITTFRSDVPRPTIAAESPIDVIVTAPELGKRYVSAESLADPGDVVLQKCLADLVPDEEGTEAPLPDQDEFPPYVLALPAEVAGTDLQVELVGIGDGPFTLRYDSGSIDLQQSAAVSGTILNGERRGAEFAGGVVGDRDRDGVVGRTDASQLPQCMSGPVQSPANDECRHVYDGDRDGDVDLYDFRRFQILFAEADAPVTCCITDICTMRTPTLCAASRGVVGPAGADCSTYFCSLPPTGPCCSEQGSCTILGEATCNSIGGTYWGDSQDCSSVHCPTPRSGGCCEPHGTCLVVDSFSCDLAAGVYLGDGVACPESPCTTVVYRNTMDLDQGFSFVPPGANTGIADDLVSSISGTFEVSEYRIAVYGGGGGPFDVVAALSTGCGATVIPMTLHKWDDVPDDGAAQILSLAFDPVDVSGPLWLSLVFSTPQAGWLVAGEAEVGTTENRCAIGQGDQWVCNVTLGTETFAGFWAELLGSGQSQQLPVDTTIRGHIQLVGGAAVPGATISASLGGLATSDANGDFALVVTAVPGTQVVLDVDATVNGLSYFARGLTYLLTGDSLLDVGTIIVSHSNTVQITGRAQFSDGTAAVLANVSTNYGGTAQADATGSFSISVTAPLDSAVRAFAIFATADETYEGRSGSVRVTTASTIDVGSIILSPVFEAPLFGQLEIPASRNSRDQATCDLDGDGFADIVTVAAQSNTALSIAWNNGHGRFMKRDTFSWSSGTYSVTCADLDLDGDNDLVATGSNALLVLRNDGSRTFAIETIDTPYRPRVAASRSDSGAPVYLAVSDRDIARIYVYRNPLSNNFSEEFPFDSIYPSQLLFADLNDDSLPELVAVASNSIAWLQGDTQGFSGPFNVVPLEGLLDGAAAADIDGDGCVDLVVTRHATSYPTQVADGFVVLHGDCNGAILFDRAYQTYTPPAGYSSPQAIGLGDVDHDGRPDIVVVLTTTTGDGALRIWVNRPDGTFLAGPVYEITLGPGSLSLTFINGDDHIDIVSTSSPPNASYAGAETTTVLLGNGNGTFGRGTSIAPNATGGPTYYSYYSAVADLFADGWPDIAFLGNSNRLNIINNDHGVLQLGNGVLLDIDDGASFVTAGRLNADARDDLILAYGSYSPVGGGLTWRSAGYYTVHQLLQGQVTKSAAAARLSCDPDRQLLPEDIVASSAGNIVVLLNDGTGTAFTQHPYVHAGPDGWLATGDMDNDGFMDIVHAGGQVVELFLNRCDSGFDRSLVADSVGSASSVAVGDLEGDGTPDIVVTDSLAKRVLILFRNESGLQRTLIKATPGYPRSVVLTDMDGDGDLDIVVANQLTSGAHEATMFSVFLNRVDGAFDDRADYWAGPNPTSIAVGDLDGDGHQDVVTTADGRVYVQYNQRR